MEITIHKSELRDDSLEVLESQQYFPEYLTIKGLFRGMPEDKPLFTKYEIPWEKFDSEKYPFRTVGLGVFLKKPIESYLSPTNDNSNKNFDLEYWKKRCELAEKVISEIPGISESTYLEYQDFIIGSESKGIHSRLHEPDEAGTTIDEEIRNAIKEVWGDEIENDNSSECANGKFVDLPNIVVDTPGAMIIQSPHIDNFRSKYPLKQ